MSEEEVILYRDRYLSEKGDIMGLASVLRKEGREEGIEQGMQQGAMKLLFRQIARRFQVSSDSVHPIFAGLTTEQLEELGERFLESRVWKKFGIGRRRNCRQKRKGQRHLWDDHEIPKKSLATVKQKETGTGTS